jgi:hypothetical protein
MPADGDTVGRDRPKYQFVINHASEALQALEAQEALERKALDEAERDFNAATNFRDTEYPKLNASALKPIDDATKELSRLNGQAQQLFAGSALKMPLLLIFKILPALCSPRAPRGKQRR